MSRRPAPARPAAGRGPAPRPLPPRPTPLTAGSAVAAVFAVCVAGCFVASWTRWDALAGWAFFMAAGLAAYYARPGALLPVVVSPPVLFLVACLCAKLATASGMITAMSAAVVTLAGVAGWMITGTGLALVIALGRGVTGEIGDLLVSFRQPRPRAR